MNLFINNPYPRKFLLILIVFAVFLTLSACFGTYQAEEKGTLAISFGRNSYEVNMVYMVTLTGDRSIIRFHPITDGKTIKGAFAVGLWTIDVEAFYEGELYATGRDWVTLTAGQNISVTVPMQGDCEHNNLGAPADCSHGQICLDCRRTLVPMLEHKMSGWVVTGFTGNVQAGQPAGMTERQHCLYMCGYNGPARNTKTFTPDAVANLETLTADGSGKLVISDYGTVYISGNSKGAPVKVENATEVYLAAGTTIGGLLVPPGDVTITGGGGVVISSSAGIENASIFGEAGTLRLEGTFGNIECEGHGISGTGGFNIIISGSVGNIKSGDHGISAAGYVTISGSVGNITSGRNGIVAFGDDGIIISGSVGHITSGTLGIGNIFNSGSNGIQADKEIIISGSVGDITVRDSTSANEGGNGISTSNDVTITGRVGNIAGGNGANSSGGAGINAYNITITGRVGSITGGNGASDGGVGIAAGSGASITIRRGAISAANIRGGMNGSGGTAAATNPSITWE